MGGLDTFYRIASYLFEDISDKKDVHMMLKKHFDAGEYGVKTGKGFYDYSDGKDQIILNKRDKDFRKLSKCLFHEK